MVSSNTSVNLWTEVVIETKFVLEGVLLPAVGCVGILGKLAKGFLDFVNLILI